MSLYGALFSGVSGLASQASAMGAIADNVTNVNTVGYKGTTVNFQTLVTKQVSITAYSPGGVQSKPRGGMDIQGLLAASNSSTDIGISGQGFFVVNQNADPARQGGGMFAYTRAGSFKADKDGFMQNVGGFYMQGWPLMRTDGSDEARPSEINIEGLTFMKAYTRGDGSLHYINSNIISEDEVKPLNLNTIGGTATATQEVRMGANLPSGDPIGGQQQTSVLTFDSLGNTHNLNFVWEKTSANNWDIRLNPPANVAALTLANRDGDGDRSIYHSAGQLEFREIPPSGSQFRIAGVTFRMGTAAARSDGPPPVITIDRTAVNTTTELVSAIKTAINEASTDAANPVIRNALLGGSNVMDGSSNTRFIADNNVLRINNRPGGSAIQVNVGPPGNAEIATSAPVQIGFTGSPIAPNDTGSITIQAGTTGADVHGETVTLNGITYQFVATAGDADAGNVAVVVAGGANQDAIATALGTAIDDSDPSMLPTVDGATVNLSYQPVSLGQSIVQVAASPDADGVPTGIFNVAAVDSDFFSLTPGSGTVTLSANPVQGNTVVLNGVTYEFRDDPGTSDPAFERVEIGADRIATASNLAAAVNAGPNNDILTAVVSGTPAENVLITAATSHTDVVTLTTSGANITADTNTILRTGERDKSALSFNGNGTPREINVNDLQMFMANGAQDLEGTESIELFLGNPNLADGMTQFAGAYQVTFITQDGARFGNFSGVSIGSDGVVTALFDNGVRRPVFQIPLATFINPNGLESLTGNSWIETDLSGQYTLRTAGQAGAGTVSAAALESSTVDLGEEFTTMITTQRAYSASAKIITTADEMLDELVRIKR